MDLVILCPTRGRPEAAREARAAFLDTRRLFGSELIFVVDDDDPEIGGYREIQSPGVVVMEQPSQGNMVGALNAAARWTMEAINPGFIGFIGDDHRFRTSRWDEIFVDLLRERNGGMVYGNDGNRRDGDIPTQIVMSSVIVKTLGWMALPSCHHLYVDNVWRVLGDEVGRLFYMPDVIIEHLHPAFGKAVWDENYRRVNSADMYNHDAMAFSAWLSTDMEEDVRRVKAALGA